MAAQSSEIINESGCFQANFKSGDGGYAADNHLITAKVRSFKPNLYGLYDMVGNVAEWTATDYTEAGNKLMGDMNPQYRRNPSGDDFHPTHRKVVKGGSWKDIYPFIRPDLRDSEQPNQGRSYIGFRCVRTRVSTGD
jgi:formylglycine-generating enzyme required for sulfatase activity